MYRPGLCFMLLALTLGTFCLAASPEKPTKKSNQTEIPETGKNTTTAVKNPKGQNAKGKTKAKKNVKDERGMLAKTKGCGPGCEVCHEDHCFSCSIGFHRINYECLKKGCVDPRCIDCSSDVCYRCVNGFAPDLDGICRWIGPNGCEDENCMLCQETRVGCTECKSGYQLRSNRCFKNACADKNCLRCSPDGKACNLCKTGYQSRLGKCLEVGCLDDNCRQCSPSGGSCYRCKPGFYNSRDDGECKSCPDPNCLNCAGSQQSCIKCSEGFYVDRTDDGSVGCVECGESVDHCMTCSRDGEDCYSCSSGYYLEHGHCIQCPDNCDSCKSPWMCDSCKDGYNLYGNGLCHAEDSVNLLSDSGAESSFPFLSLVLACLFHLAIVFTMFS